MDAKKKYFFRIFWGEFRDSDDVEGKIVEIKIKPVKGLRPLTGSKLKDFEEFLENFSEKIVEKWIDYFVYHKNIEFEKITKRIK